ncbi:prevent-host-death protein [Bosea sp. AAP35]|uniref:type II toxin-antitoxin system Phd/YefM family antitoxin n=1 Tax=Bosea sp. AAP35 TaxID=1523417 RepID=UPI0006B90F3C|nr:type II toxin-antitoxin system Phd/YefM family antitoxin [Bosea sp. AAP35]KPF62421.1 prevent-host-death protein [Bosea sp. AAP35]
MDTVNIHDSKTHLSRLLEKVARGESFIIAEAGKPMAKVVPLDASEKQSHRRIGFMVGEFTTPDDFDSMAAAEIEELFSGKPLSYCSIRM